MLMCQNTSGTSLATQEHPAEAVAVPVGRFLCIRKNLVLTLGGIKLLAEAA